VGNEEDPRDNSCRGRETLRTPLLGSLSPFSSFSLSSLLRPQRGALRFPRLFFLLHLRLPFVFSRARLLAIGMRRDSRAVKSIRVRARTTPTAEPRAESARRSTPTCVTRLPACLPHVSWKRAAIGRGALRNARLSICKRNELLEIGFFRRCSLRENINMARVVTSNMWRILIVVCPHSGSDNASNSRLIRTSDRMSLYYITRDEKIIRSARDVA